MATTIDREWITAELNKEIYAEERLVQEARSRTEAPPDIALGALYGQMAEADQRHRRIIETIAIRYGLTPARSVSGGLGEAITRIKERVTEMGSSPIDRVEEDLLAKARAIHRYSAWIAAFEALGDAESAREFAAILTEETAHRDALLEGLKSLVVQRAHRRGEAEEPGKSSVRR